MAPYSALLALVLTSVVPVPGLAQDPVRSAAGAGQEATDANTFFSGNVVELAADHVIISKSVLGKPPERRTFKIDATTKVEGKMKQKSRVTVRYASSEDGDVAVSILVRAEKGEAKKK